MTSKKSLFSALAGVAMLALPVSAFAGHHHGWDDHQRPVAGHDQGWHRGWFKHHGYEARPVWHHDDDDCDFRPRERGPAVLCDSDGDDCEPAYGRDWDNDDYGPLSWYQAQPPASYAGQQRRQFLLQRRQRAMYVMQLMRSRHDTRAANRMAGVVRSLDGRLGRGRPAPANAYFGPSAPYYNNAAYNPNYGNNTAYDPNYGLYPNYQTRPGLNTLGNLVGPLLGQPSY